MNPALQLRTVRDVSTGAAKPSGVQIPPSAATPPPTASSFPELEHPRLTAPAKSLLNMVLQYKLFDRSQLPTFLQKVGDRLPQLNTAQRTADALVHLGFLTNYQRTRLVSGQLFGLSLGPYHILDRLGGGTVSAVFLGQHKYLHRKVAIKVLTQEFTQRPEVQQRFLQEARILAKLNHPNIVAIHDAGFEEHPTSPEESLWYIVLELLGGGDLEQYVEKNGLPPLPLACEWINEAANALQAAHDAGLTHRDIKPSNLILTESLHAKVTDFGLAREWRSTNTPVRSELGTFGFAPAEQIDNPTTVGPPADVYALGVCLFWLLSGQCPYPKDATVGELLTMLQTGKTLRLSEVFPKAPSKLDELLSRMLALQPSRRPTMAEVARQLQPFAEASPYQEVSGRMLFSQSGPDEETLRRNIQLLEQSAEQRQRNTERAQDAVLNAWQVALLARSGENAGIGKRLELYCQNLISHMRKYPMWAFLTDEKIVRRFLTLLPIHDLGLLALPDALTRGNKERTPDEELAYRQHTEYGTQILLHFTAEHGDGLPFLRELHQLVRHHHERWDGTGFPDGLSAEMIPWTARLLALAEGYDSLRRQHRDKEHGHERAVAEIVKEAGLAYDPEMVKLFQKWAREWDSIYETIPDAGDEQPNKEMKV